MRVLQPIAPRDVDQLIASSVELRLAARSAVNRSRSLIPALARSHRAALLNRLASRSHLCYARIAGEVGDEPVTAVVRRDGSVTADPLLLDRARLVVELGDAFDDGRLPACLSDNPLASAMTLVRACDRVRSIRMAVPTAARSEDR